MPRVAYRTADKHGSKRRFSQQSRHAISRKLWCRERIFVHLADLAEYRHVNLGADERRQGEHFVQVTYSADEILVTQQFIQSVRGQPSYSSKEELWRTNIVIAEGRAAAPHHENRITVEDWLKILRQHVERGESLCRTGIRVVIIELRTHVVPLRRYHSVVGVIKYIARLQRSDAPVIRRE